MKFLIIIGVAFFGYVFPGYVTLFAKNSPERIPFLHKFLMSLASALIATGIIYW